MFFVHFLSTQQATLLSLGLPQPPLQRLDPPRQGIRVFQVRLMLHLRHLPHFPQLGRCIKKKKAGRGGVVLWGLSQEGGFIPGYTTEACV